MWRTSICRPTLLSVAAFLLCFVFCSPSYGGGVGALKKESLTVYEADDYFFVGDKEYARIFLMKGPKGKCHPYQFAFSIFDTSDFKQKTENGIKYYAIDSENQSLSGKYFSSWAMA